jgi:hypothetical protein
MIIKLKTYSDEWDCRLGLGVVPKKEKKDTEKEKEKERERKKWDKIDSQVTRFLLNGDLYKPTTIRRVK